MTVINNKYVHSMYTSRIMYSHDSVQIIMVLKDTLADQGMYHYVRHVTCNCAVSMLEESTDQTTYIRYAENTALVQ